MWIGRVQIEWACGGSSRSFTSECGELDCAVGHSNLWRSCDWIVQQLLQHLRLKQIVLYFTRLPLNFFCCVDLVYIQLVLEIVSNVPWMAWSQDLFVKLIVDVALLLGLFQLFQRVWNRNKICERRRVTWTSLVFALSSNYTNISDNKPLILHLESIRQVNHRFYAVLSLYMYTSICVCLLQCVQQCQWVLVCFANPLSLLFGELTTLWLVCSTPFTKFLTIWLVSGALVALSSSLFTIWCFDPFLWIFWPELHLNWLIPWFVFLCPLRIFSFQCLMHLFVCWFFFVWIFVCLSL